jgi:hypothetical protein
MTADEAIKKLHGELEKELNDEMKLHNKLNQIKNPETNDLRVFASAILNYLNKFTQYKTPKNVIATLKQCRIIFNVLKDADFIKDDKDENYIHTYLQQVAKNQYKKTGEN